MSEHDPICADFNKHAQVWCICSRLKSAEQRGRREASDPAWIEGLLIRREEEVRTQMVRSCFTHQDEAAAAERLRIRKGVLALTEPNPHATRVIPLADVLDVISATEDADR
jgi:hypothetical protein